MRGERIRQTGRISRDRLALLYLHIVAALLAFVGGAVALSAAKGRRLHRMSGMLFAYAMLIMSCTGVWIAVSKGQALNVVTGGVVIYLVSTGVLTALPLSIGRRRILCGALLASLTLTVAGVWYGIEALTARQPIAAAFFIFGGLTSVGAWGDWRQLRQRVAGRERIARHLWRMGVAALIGALALPRALPPALNIPILVAVPALLVLVTTLYWLARTLSNRGGPAGGALIKR